MTEHAHTTEVNNICGVMNPFENLMKSINSLRRDAQMLKTHFLNIQEDY